MEWMRARVRQAYEDGMARRLFRVAAALKPRGASDCIRNKQPDAWETLVSAIIRAGFYSERLLAHPDGMGNRVSFARRSPALLRRVG